MASAVRAFRGGEEDRSWLEAILTFPRGDSCGDIDNLEAAALPPSFHASEGSARQPSTPSDEILRLAQDDTPVDFFTTSQGDKFRSVVCV